MIPIRGRKLCRIMSSVCSLLLMIVKLNEPIRGRKHVESTAVFSFMVVIVLN